MRKTGTFLFWLGFALIMGIVGAYLIMTYVGTAWFTAWVTSLTVCGIVIVGAVMMVIGRALERKSGSEF